MYLLTVVYITVARLPVVLHWTAAELGSTGVAKISDESGQWIDKVHKGQSNACFIAEYCAQQV